jgi:hypothetical protein
LFGGDLGNERDSKNAQGLEVKGLGFLQVGNNEPEVIDNAVKLLRRRLFRQCLFPEIF